MQSRQAALQQTEKKDTTPEDEEKPKEGVVAERKRANNICRHSYSDGSLKMADLDSAIDNASNFTTGQAAASLTSTALAPTTRNDKALFDEVGDCLYNPSAGTDSACCLGRV